MVMIVLFVVVVVIPQVDSLALALRIMPLDLGLEVRVLSGLAVLVARYGVLMITSLVTKFPCLLLGYGTVLVVFTIGMAMVMSGCRVKIAVGCGGNG